MNVKMNVNISVNMNDMRDVYRSALAGISTDGKIEHLKVTQKAIIHLTKMKVALS